MKRTSLTFALVFLFVRSFAQIPSLALEDMKHYRIQMDNRSNRHLMDVPKQLLDGYCTGIYKAYYPKAIFNEVNFGDFLAHFRWGEPLMNESVMCGESYCSNPAFTEFFSRFNACIDFYEYSFYNSQTARMERKIPFVQLVYSMDISGKKYLFKGPLFRMDEIDKTIRLRSDEINNAEVQSLKYTFDLGRYLAVEITDKDLKSKEKQTRREDDFQEH